MRLDWRAGLLSIGLVVAVATACSSTPSSGSPSPLLTGTTAPAARATVAQLAGVVAAYGSVVREEVAFESTCTVGECFAPERRFGRYQIIAEHSLTLERQLEMQGTPPAEVADVAGRTTQAVDRVNSAWAPMRQCENDTGSLSSCGSSVSAFVDAVDQLSTVVDAWKPYL